MIRLLLVITKTKAQSINDELQEELEKEKKEQVKEDSKEQEQDQGQEQEQEDKKSELPPVEYAYHTDLESIATLRENYSPLADKITSFTQRMTKYAKLL